MTDFLRAVIAACIALAGLQALAADDAAAVIIDSDDSIVLLGGRVHPPRPIPHNMAAAGGRVIIDQPIGHNAAVAGGTVEVKAPIGSKLAAAGGTVTIDSAVGGSVGAAGGEVRITKNASIGGSARITGARIEVDGIVRGSLHAAGETLTINGEVRGDVDADVEYIVLGPNAKVGGNIAYVSQSELKRSEGATVGGEIRRGTGASAARAEAASKAATVIGWVAIFMVFLFVLGAGAIFLAIAPIFSVEAPDRLRSNPGKSLGMGLLTVIGAPMLAVLFMITVVGIPVGVLIFAVYPLTLLLGFIVGILWFASWGAQMAKRPPPATVPKAIGYFALALLIVTIVSKVPVLGGLLVGLLLIVGVGAFEVELFRRMRTGSGARARVEVVRP